MNVLLLSARNLMRYRRRTLLTTLLITVGIMAVLLFIAVAGSFKQLMVGEITDSMLGHLQVHRRGYVAAIDNLPLNLNLGPERMEHLEQVLGGMEEVEAWSARVKFGAMFSNFTETTNIRLNGVLPERELATVPQLGQRLVEGDGTAALLEPGQILVPDLLARGMNLGVGDTVVLVATNQDGSVNGRPFQVGGVLASATGPGGRDGYVHLADARDLLRMEADEVSEVAVRLRSLDMLETAAPRLDARLAEVTTPQGQPLYEVHTWERLSPFVNIANMIDLMNVFIQVLLISIVLISIMNVMIMAVFERVREIGTLSAIGTAPRRILALFVTEGLLLGTLGAAVGTVLSLGAVWVLNAVGLTFSFARQDALLLEPTMAAADVVTVAVIVIIVAVLASLQPAVRASRMDPITALRHN